jgi:phospholipid-translocating ATPase
MLDGFYQSVICFFVAYLLYRPAQNVSPTGLDLSDRTRMGVFVAFPTIMVSNVYILLNMYRWDWLSVLINAISTLLVLFWTGVYTSVESAGQFYGAATEVFGSLTFWTLTLLIVVMCLTPRFTIKALQKIYYPIDTDIIREQVTQGRFKHLDNFEAYVPPDADKLASSTSSDLTKPIDSSPKRPRVELPDDERPIYPPSVAPTTTTHNPRSQNGSDGTYGSVDYGHPQPQSIDRIRQSWDPNRLSLERTRASFEASRDFTSAAMLTRVESSYGRDSDNRG